MAVGWLCTPPLLLVVKAMERLDRAGLRSRVDAECAGAHGGSGQSGVSSVVWIAVSVRDASWYTLQPAVSQWIDWIGSTNAARSPRFEGENNNKTKQKTKNEKKEKQTRRRAGCRPAWGRSGMEGARRQAEHRAVLRDAGTRSLTYSLCDHSLPTPDWLTTSDQPASRSVILPCRFTAVDSSTRSSVHPTASSHWRSSSQQPLTSWTRGR